MSERIDLDAIREFAEITRDHPNELVYSDAVLALIDVFEQANIVVMMKRPLNGGGPLWEALSAALARFRTDT